MKKTISIALIIIWMAVIFWFSSMPGDESNTKSKSTIKEAIETIIPRKKAEETISNEVNEISQNTQSQNQTKITTNPETKDANTTQIQQNQKEEQLIEKLNKPLRKCMHATEYLILSILILNWLRNYEIKEWKAVVISIIISQWIEVTKLRLFLIT